MNIAEFDQEMANTRKLLERVPDDRMDYKPHPKSMPLGRLASHIAEIPNWAATTLQVDVLELSAGMQPFVAGSREELLAHFDAKVAEARPVLEKATDEDLAKIWTMRFNGKDMFSMPKSVVLRSMCMNHLIHHRAQLGVYLRLNEIEIPGMYGPSADEAKWWEAAKA